MLEFLQAAGEANAEEMQTACLLETEAQTKALNSFVSELFVTVSRRDVTINETGYTFRYCLAGTWEQRQPVCDTEDAGRLLSRQRANRQIDRLLSSKIENRKSKRKQEIFATC